VDSSRTHIAPQNHPAKSLYDNTWREAFAAWCEATETDERGYIIPAEIDDEGDNDD
jgi:hypothetical protein